MTDEGKAGWAVVLWSIGFHAGVFIAAGINKAVGITLMICSTAILVTVLYADARYQAQKRARDNWRKYQEKIIMEALKNAGYIDSDTDTHR
jgi:hypothetical protein